MYPILFEPFGFQVSSFGILVALGALAGGRLFAKALSEHGYDRERAWSILFWTLLAGILGAKLWYVGEMVTRTSSEYLIEFLASRGGLTWYGGLVGGGIAVLVTARLYGIPLRIATHCAAPGVAIGQCLGRVGCFLVGDDYGRPTDLPWGIAFPQGLPPTEVPVHPTMLYEAAWLAAMTWFLWKRRHTSPYLFAEYLVLAGIGRFFNELVRENPVVVAGMTNAQLTALASIALGVGLALYFRSAPRSPHEPATAEHL